VVVALMDGKTLNTWSAHAVQDALMTWAYQGGGEAAVAEGVPAKTGGGSDLARRGR